MLICVVPMMKFSCCTSQKQATMARPLLQTTGTPAVSLGVNVDFRDDDVLSALTFSQSSYGVWDTATWDSGIWGAGLTPLSNWQTVSGIGFCFAPQIRVQSAGIETHWQATDLVWKPGGVL